MVSKTNWLMCQEFEADKEAYLLRITRDNTQFLINHMFELPTENTDVGPIVMDSLVM